MAKRHDRQYVSPGCPRRTVGRSYSGHRKARETGELARQSKPTPEDQGELIATHMAAMASPTTRHLSRTVAGRVRPPAAGAADPVPGHRGLWPSVPGWHRRRGRRPGRSRDRRRGVSAQPARPARSAGAIPDVDPSTSRFTTLLRDRMPRITDPGKRTYDPDNPARDVNEESCPSMPIVMVCIHDGRIPSATDRLRRAFPPECAGLQSRWSPPWRAEHEASRYVEVRICYRFSPSSTSRSSALGDLWLQKDRVFTVADYPPPPTPEPPPPPSRRRRKGALGGAHPERRARRLRRLPSRSTSRRAHSGADARPEATPTPTDRTGATP